MSNFNSKKQTSKTRPDFTEEFSQQAKRMRPAVSIVGDDDDEIIEIESGYKPYIPMPTSQQQALPVKEEESKDHKQAVEVIAKQLTEIDLKAEHDDDAKPKALEDPPESRAEFENQEVEDESDDEDEQMSDDSKVSSLVDEGDPNALLEDDESNFNLEDYLKFKAKLEEEEKANRQENSQSEEEEEPENLWGSESSESEEEEEERHKINRKKAQKKTYGLRGQKGGRKSHGR